MTKHRKRQHAVLPNEWHKRRGNRGRYKVKGIVPAWWDEMPTAKVRQILKRNIQHEIESWQ